MDYKEMLLFINLSQNNYFLIIGREKISGLSIDIDSIYELYNYAPKKYQLQNKYNLNLIDNINLYKTVIEDKGSGSTFFNKLILNIKSLDGKSNLVKYIKDNRFNKIEYMFNNTEFEYLMEKSISDETYYFS